MKLTSQCTFAPVSHIDQSQTRTCRATCEAAEMQPAQLPPVPADPARSWLCRPKTTCSRCESYVAEVSYPARDPLLPSAKSPSPPAAGSPWPRPPLPAPAGSSPPRSRRRACPASARRSGRSHHAALGAAQPAAAAGDAAARWAAATPSALPSAGPSRPPPPRAPPPPPAMSGAGGHLGVRGLPSCVAGSGGLRPAGCQRTGVSGRECGLFGAGSWGGGGGRRRRGQPQLLRSLPLRCLFVPLRHVARSRCSSLCRLSWGGLALRLVLDFITTIMSLRSERIPLQTPRRFSALLGRALVPAREQRGLTPTPQPVRGTRCSSELGCVWCWRWRTDQGVLRVCQGRVVTLYYSNSCGFCVRLVSVGRMELCSYLSITLWWVPGREGVSFWMGKEAPNQALAYLDFDIKRT